MRERIHMRLNRSQEMPRTPSGIGIVIVAILTVSCCGCTRSPEDAFNKGDYLNAAELWLQKAEHGDLDAACPCLVAIKIIAEGGSTTKEWRNMLPLGKRLEKVSDQLEKRDGADIDRKKLAKFFSCFEPYLARAARSGNSNAEYLLSEQYRGEEGKAAEVERLVKLAAEKGNPKAQYQMGVKHVLDNDQSTVARWWKLSAAKGYYPALQNLGLMYRDGQGVPQDFELAAKLFSDGAEQGYRDAQMEIGQMCAKGQGTPQDFVKAHFWFNVAGTKGSEQERRQANEARDAIARSMTNEQVAAAQRLARDWKQKE